MTSAANARIGLIERIDELPEVTYGSADLGNVDDALAETAYIALSKQTREAVSGARRKAPASVLGR